MSSFKQKKDEDRLAALGLVTGKIEDIEPTKIEVDGWETVEKVKRLEAAGLAATPSDLKAASELVQQKLNALEERVGDEKIFATLTRMIAGLVEAGKTVLDSIAEVEKIVDESTVGGKVQMVAEPKGYNRAQKRFFQQNARRAQDEGFAFKVGDIQFDDDGNAIEPKPQKPKTKRPRKQGSGKPKGKRR